MDTAFTTTLPALADRSQLHDGEAGFKAPPGAARWNAGRGWTPDRQRAFLESIAEGHTVASACGLVGMAPSSAYALRRRAAGAGVALGWRAAGGPAGSLAAIARRGAVRGGVGDRASVTLV